jgi:hypothetical protein
MSDVHVRISGVVETRRVEIRIPGKQGPPSAGATGTTVGVNLFTLTNPSAISFLRINANNTVTAQSASAFRTSLSVYSTAEVDAAVAAAPGTYTDEKAQDAVGAMVDATLVYVDATPALGRAALTGHVTAVAGSNALVLGSFTKAQLTAAVSDGDPLYVGDATTVGGNIFNLTNPSAITFLRLNADNTVDALSAAAFRAAIGAGSGGGDLVAANNLSDVADKPTSRTNLGLGIGVNVQAYSANLTTYAGIAPSANVQSLLGAANYAAMKTLLSLTVGTDIPARSPSIQSVTSASTVTPTFADDQVNITAQAAALTLANPTGTAVDGWGIVIRIKDNGTARAIAYGGQYRALGVTLPTTTVISKMLYLGMIFNNADTKWDVVSVAQEA